MDIVIIPNEINDAEGGSRRMGLHSCACDFPSKMTPTLAESPHIGHHRLQPRAIANEGNASVVFLSFDMSGDKSRIFWTLSQRPISG